MGAQHLREMFDDVREKWPDISDEEATRRAVVAYNSGFSSVTKAVRAAASAGDEDWTKHVRKEGRDYLPRVLERMKKYKAHVGD